MSEKTASSFRRILLRFPSVTDEVQGFYLAMPMHAEALTESLGKKHGKQIERPGTTEWFDHRKV